MPGASLRAPPADQRLLALAGLAQLQSRPVASDAPLRQRRLCGSEVERDEVSGVQAKKGGATMTEDQASLLSKLARGRTSRREFMRQGTLLGLSVPTLLRLLEAPAAAKAGSKVVNVASYGGSYNDNFRKGFLDAFEKETDIKVNLGANASLALAKLQAESGNPQWDIVELTGSEYEVAVQQSLVQRLDYKKIDTSKVPAYLKKPHGIMYALFLFVKAYDQRKIPDARAPRTWAEFWDTGRYPIKRSLYQIIADGSLLEAALMADGVPMDRVYPIDIERALKSLDRLGKRNIIWHSTNQEPIQQLTSGEVALATSWNGRVLPARQAGAQTNFTADQGVVSGDYLPVVKGAPNREAAYELINFIATNDVAAAQFMVLTTYATSNARALSLLPKNLADQLPTGDALKSKVLMRNDAWWAEHLESATTRFKQWQVT